MDKAIFVSSIAILAVGVILFVLSFRKKAPTINDASQNMMLELLESLRRELRETQQKQQNQTQGQLDRMNSQMMQSLTGSQKIIQEVTEKLTTLDQTNKQVLDFSSQLKNLQGILQNPKQRGVLGEYWLETLLSNVLPPDAYKMQFQIGTDENTKALLIADAVIFVRDQIIPIDAKFSLENFNRMMAEENKEQREKYEKELKSDVKRRIDETSKYIQPQNGTLGFAFMFIPAEGVYYSLLNAEVGSSINSINLIEYAFEKHVLMVSPTSFFAYLQTVLLGLRELQLEKSTHDILKRVAQLGKHIHQYADLHDRVGKNLATVVNQYNLSSRELSKVDTDVHKLTNGEVGEMLELEIVAKPEEE